MALHLLKDQPWKCATTLAYDFMVYRVRKGKVYTTYLKFNQSCILYLCAPCRGIQKGAVHPCASRDIKVVTVKVFCYRNCLIWMQEKLWQLATLKPIDTQGCISPFWKHLISLYLDAIDQRCISMFNVCLAQLKRACLLHNWAKGPFSLSTFVHS